jgi:hypothetical protein
MNSESGSSSMALVDYGNETPIGTPRGASIEAFDGASVSSDVKSPGFGVETYPSGKPQIFKAIYSGVPVFEMICRGVAVMRRRSDSYLNATQILKVADFDKPQRTRILEREVQKGEHEKVQGGYGKYQGTNHWTNTEDTSLALSLALHVNLLHSCVSVPEILWLTNPLSLLFFCPNRHMGTI